MHRVGSGPQAREKDFQGLNMNSKKSWLITVSCIALFATPYASPLWAQQAANPSGGVPKVASNTNPRNTLPANSVPRGTQARPNAANPLAPAWYPLSANQQQYLDKVLSYWEFKSSKIKRYRCNFRRWEYDPVFGPKDKNTFKTFSEGVVKYSAPDKGLFKVLKMSQYQAPRNPGEKAAYKAADQSLYEHWVCDGQWVYQFDYKDKKLVQTELPPELRGKAIGNGPLPFLFNAKADDIKRRFWLHVITPAQAKGEYWLEAVPRTKEDAGNFAKIHVIIDEADYLPKAMILFDSNQAASRTTFEFFDREVNFNILAAQLNLFHREFYEPAAPRGWEKKVNKWNQSVAPATASNPNAGKASSR